MRGQRFCVAGGWASTRDAEHGYWEARDLIGSCYPFVGTSFEGAERVMVCGADDPRELPDLTRLFVFPGQAGLRSTLTIGELLLTTGIDEVCGLAGTAPGLDDVLDTQDFVRPRRQDGRLVLTVRAAEGDRYVPFEQPHPTPCCGNH
jgi:hypothetical protein